MASIEVKVNNIPKVEAELKKAVLVALEKCGMIAEGNAKENITQNGNVDTGNLRNSITHKVDESDHSVIIGTNVEYGKYIELGTGKYAKGGRRTAWIYQDAKGEFHKTEGYSPHPFLKPAITEHLDEYKKAIESAFK